MRLRENLLPIVQTAGAAALAWLLATTVFGHANPVFAPIAAIVSLGATRGQRAQRAVELMLGVAVGITAGDLLTSVIVVGVWQLAVIISDVGVLARAAVRAIRLEDPIPGQLPAALRSLGDAADALATRIGSVEDDPEVSAPALRAVAAATELEPDAHHASLCVLVAYTQATAADLLRALGIDRDPAHERVAETARAATDRGAQAALR